VSTKPSIRVQSVGVSEESHAPSHGPRPGHATHVSPHLCATSRARRAQTTRCLGMPSQQRPAHLRAELANTRHLGMSPRARMRPRPLPPRRTHARAFASRPPPLGTPFPVHSLARVLSCWSGISSSSRRNSRVKAIAEWLDPAPRHGPYQSKHLSGTELNLAPAAAQPKTSVV